MVYTKKCFVNMITGFLDVKKVIKGIDYKYQLKLKNCTGNNK